MGKAKDRVVKKRARKAPEEAQPIWGVTGIPGCLVAILPIATVSEGNCFESWKTKHHRHKAQKAAVAYALAPYRLPLPVKVTVVRYASRFLDEHDNLRMALKYLVDAVSEHLLPGLRPGRADDDKRISWHYGQEKSTHKYVKIIIEKEIS